MFSYGSGCASSIFRMQFKSTKNIKNITKVEDRLDQRIALSPEEYINSLKLLEGQGKPNFVPNSSQCNLIDGTYFLHHIDEQYRRFYQKKQK